MHVLTSGATLHCMHMRTSHKYTYSHRLTDISSSSTSATTNAVIGTINSTIDPTGNDVGIGAVGGSSEHADIDAAESNSSIDSSISSSASNNRDASEHVSTSRGNSSSSSILYDSDQDEFAALHDADSDSSTDDTTSAIGGFTAPVGFGDGLNAVHDNDVLQDDFINSLFKNDSSNYA
jgi:hypothetical protein